MSLTAPPPPNVLDLSDDVIILILQNLSGVDLARVSQVSKRLRRLALHPSLWKRACYKLSNFPSRQARYSKSTRADFWRICFRQFYCRPNGAVCLGCMKTVNADRYDPTVIPMCTFVRSTTSEQTRSSTAE